MDRVLIMAVIAPVVLAAAILVLFPDIGRHWRHRLVGRFADFRGSQKPVLAGRGGTTAGLDDDPPVFADGAPGGSASAVNDALLERLEEQILANLSRAMPINLHYVASDADCVILAEKLWNFLGRNGFRRGAYSGALTPGSAIGLHITMTAESCEMTIAPPR